MWSPSQAAALRAAKRKPSVYPKIDLMPFLVIFLAILIILMMSGPHEHDFMRFRFLPGAVNATPQPSAAREDAMLVFIPRDGSVFFRYERVSFDELRNLIRAGVGDGAKREVYLAVDRKARYGDVKPVIDQIQLAGIKSVVILAGKPEQ